MMDRTISASASRAPARRGTVFLTLLAFAFLLVGAVLVLMAHERSAQIILVILALFAAIGLMGLLALTLGFIDWRPRAAGTSITRWIADTAGEGFLVVEQPGNRIIYANSAYLALSGATDLADVVDIEMLFGRSPEAAEALFRLLKAAKQGEEGQEDVRLVRSLNGSAPAWYRIKTMPMAQNGGNPSTLWSAMDITRERERQENVFQELQYAIDYLDHAPAGFLSLNPDGEVVYLNATLAQWLGRDLAEFGTGGLKVSDLVTANGEVLLKALRGKPGQTHLEIIDTDFRAANDSLLPVRLFHQVSFNADGMSGASRTLVLNRASGETSDEGQRVAELRFSRFFNNSPFGIATIAANGRILRMNAAFARLLPDSASNASINREPMIGAILADADRSMLDSRIASAVAGKGDQPPMDLQLALDARSARVYVTSVDGGDEESDAAILYVLDTTDQRALEAQFAQAQKMQAVGELAGGIAHDFNNVLQGILGYADLLLANHRPTDPSFQDIMQIKQNANRAASLVRHLLAFSRRQTLRPVVVQFTEVLSDLSTLLKRLLGQRIEFDVRHERDLWLVKADPTQFEQVIINLAMNARDAMPHSGKLTVSTSNMPASGIQALGDKTIPAADYVMVEVADTGGGISPEILDKIFEPFFTTKEVGKGTGLGLSMVYGFVKQSGGYIVCESTVGEGTRFRILLPRHIATVEETSAALAEATPQPKAVATDLSGQGTVLLVEDEDAVRAFAARALVQRGYKVLEATSGIEALEILGELDGEVDLIVSDVVMPEMDGPTFLREARANGVKARIIFASGYAEEAFSKNLPEGEEFGFLPKPFSLKQLTETVKAAIG
jgi:two-component system cell cycle sensor histidine kinase/response regulator CckA